MRAVTVVVGVMGGAAALVVASCGGSGSSGDVAGGGGACAAVDAIVVASDYSSSAVGGFDLDGGGSPLTAAVDLGKDPALARTSAGRAFYVARDEDVVFELDPKCGKPIAKTQVHDATSTRTSNPQDVAVAGDGSMWVPLFNVPAVLVVGAGDAGGATSRIDLSALDGDGNPNASAMQIVGNDAFVALERLDDDDQLKPKQPSMIVHVDVATRTVGATLQLVARDPFGPMVPFDGAFWLAAPGSFGAVDEEEAGIERFDPASFTSRLVVREKDLGGSVVAVALDGGCGAAIVADATPNVNATALVTFDPSTGRVLAPASAPVLATPGFDLAGLGWVDGELLVGDRRAGAGAGGGFAVHAFARTAPDACALAQQPDRIELRQKPVALAPAVTARR